MNPTRETLPRCDESGRSVRQDSGGFSRSVLFSMLLLSAMISPMQAADYTLTPDPNGMTLKAPDGKPVFTYLTRKPENSNLAANSTCCFHPLNAPSGERVTDLAPGDHHHHRGVFLAWHSLEFREKADFTAFGPLGPTRGFNINRGDFWGWGQFAPTAGRVITNRAIQLLEADASHARIEIRNEWLIDNRVMMHEVTLASLHSQSNAYILDLSYQLTPVTDLVLNQTAFGGFCVRARNDGDSQYVGPKGKIELPDPHYSVPDLNWPGMDWYDFTIQLKGGKTVGVTVLDHPDNPPATWHNPRYVWMLNPCIVAQKPVILKANEPFHLQYRLLVHDGPTPVNLIEALNRDWKKR
jgi:hypothetical protein